MSRRGFEAIFCVYFVWKQLFPNYSLTLHSKCAQSKGLESKDQGIVEPNKLQQVVDSGGHLPLSHVLRLQVRFMTAESALGATEFLSKIGQNMGARGAYRMRGGDWGDLITYRNLQLAPIQAKLLTQSAP